MKEDQNILEYKLKNGLPKENYENLLRAVTIENRKERN